jgi:hypothetical protein
LVVPLPRQAFALKEFASGSRVRSPHRFSLPPDRLEALSHSVLSLLRFFAVEMIRVFSAFASYDATSEDESSLHWLI